MRFKLDENITVEAVDVLRRFGHDVDTVVSEGLRGADDHTVREAASDAGRMVVTFDVGFADSRGASERQPGVVLLRLDNQRPANVLLVLTQLATNHELDAFAGCVVVVTERLVRVRRPDIV